VVRQLGLADDVLAAAMRFWRGDRAEPLQTSVTPLEPMAGGRPVVAARIGALPSWSSTRPPVGATHGRVAALTKRALDDPAAAGWVEEGAAHRPHR
jgi:hypothetical protein